MAAEPSPDPYWALEVEASLEPSPIPREILDNNAPVSEAQLAPLQDFLSRATPRRTRLDSKIAILQAALDKTWAERAVLDTEIRKHESAVFLIRRLPAELLSLIFSFVPTYDLLEDDVEGPWLVSAVCGRWRAIALSQPSLWAWISLDFSTGLDFEEVDFDARFARLEAHLQRSAQAPLAIEFQCYSDGDCITRNEEYRALDILKKHSHRWETIQMVGPKPLFSHLDNSFPLLRKLDVYVYPEVDEDDVGTLATFAKCPRLQVATVNEGSFASPSRVLLPFHQLLRYKACNLTTRHLDVLRVASDSLVECALHVGDDSTLLPGRIQLPSLRRLSVSGTAILGALDTPALCELYCFRHSTALYSFLARQKALQKLVVAQTSSVDDMTQLLHAVSSITELGLYVPIDLASDFWTALAPSQDRSSTLLHSLTTLTVGFIPPRRFQVNPAPIDQDLLMRTIEAQWQAGHWRSVKFYCMRMSPSQDLLDRMRVLQNQGLKIELFSSPYALDRTMIPRYFDADNKPYATQELFWKLHEEEEREQQG